MARKMLTNRQRLKRTAAEGRGRCVDAADTKKPKRAEKMMDPGLARDISGA